MAFKLRTRREYPKNIPNNHLKEPERMINETYQELALNHSGLGKRSGTAVLPSSTIIEGGFFVNYEKG